MTSLNYHNYKEWQEESKEETIFRGPILNSSQEVKKALESGEDTTKNIENVVKLIENMSDVNRYICQYPYLYPIHFAVSIGKLNS